MSSLQCRSTMMLVAVGLCKNVATTFIKHRSTVAVTSHAYSSLRDRGRTTVARLYLKLLLGVWFPRIDCQSHFSNTTISILVTQKTISFALLSRIAICLSISLKFNFFSVLCVIG